MISVAWGLGCPLQEHVSVAPEIDGGVGWTAKTVRCDFDPTAHARMVDFLSIGRNRRPVRLAVLHGEFDFRALFLFAHFLFGQAKRKWATYH